MLESIKQMTISVTTDGTGAAAQDSPSKIRGEILKLIYDKGTVNAATTAVTKCKQSLTGSVSEQIDSYDVNGGSAIRYPVVALLGAAAGDNKWGRFCINDYLRVTVTGGAASKTFSITVLYK